MFFFTLSLFSAGADDDLLATDAFSQPGGGPVSVCAGLSG
jgi:hypothetical protein